MIKKKKSFRSQIIYIFLLSFAVIFFVDICIFNNMKAVFNNANKTYEGNRKLVEMRKWLDNMQAGMNEYLNTKDESEINLFYVYEEKYKALIANMDHDSAMTVSQVREKNVYNMSDAYILYANMATLAKKNGDVLKYRDYQAKAKEQYEYLSAYLIEINTELFDESSTTYQKMQTLNSGMFSIYIVIMILAGVANVCLLILLTKRLTLSLQRLADTAKEVEQGNLDVHLSDHYDWNEVGDVNRAFNQMVISLKDYIEKFKKSVEKESALREQSIIMQASVNEAELKYLRAQIDPHFLFNTLNAGAQLAMMEEADKTYRYIHKVADFFRFKIKQDDYMATLAEEIQLVDDYIYIINVRYAGAIEYSKNVDESLERYSIPRMILQPLVENCIKHGLSEVEYNKKIELTVYEEEGNIVVSIADNGVGMDRETIDRMLAKTTEHHEDSGTGIGLANVVLRMRTMYSNDNVVEITSVGKNMGTEIALYIPKEIKEK